MKIKQLNLLLTYKCLSHCQHCCYFCSLEGRGLITASDVKNYLDSLKDHPLKSLWIYGGEPFLYPEVLTEMIKIARGRRIPRIGVLTNGYWAKRNVMARKRLSLLKEAGLNALIVSTDGFHSRRIDPDLAIRAAHLAADVGVEEVSYSVSFIAPKSSSNPFNERSKEIWDQLRANDDLSIQENAVITVGRAAESLLEYYQLVSIDDRTRCRPPDYIGGTWEQPEGLEIDPQGWVMICPGLSLGKVGGSSLSQLLQGYDHGGDKLWRTFHQQGPSGLLHLAEKKGYRKLPGYAGLCHLCYDVRKFLRPYFPHHLAPDSCYQEPYQVSRRMR